MTADPAETTEGRLHAGLELGTLNTIVFDNAEQLRDLLKRIGLKTDGAGRILDPTSGSPIACTSCAEDVGVDNIGHVLPGSIKVYCRDPACILDYLERFG